MEEVSESESEGPDSESEDEFGRRPFDEQPSVISPRRQPNLTLAASDPPAAESTPNSPLATPAAASFARSEGSAKTSAASNPASPAATPNTNKESPRPSAAPSVGPVGVSVEQLQEQFADLPSCVAVLRLLFGAVEHRVMFADGVDHIYPQSHGAMSAALRAKVSACFASSLEESRGGRGGPVGDDDQLGATILAVLQSKSATLIPRYNYCTNLLMRIVMNAFRREAFTGVVTLDKLRKEHRKHGSHPSSVVELWDSLTQHLQKLVESHSAALSHLSRFALYRY